MQNRVKIRNKDRVLSLGYECLKQYHQDTNYAMLAITFKGLQKAMEMFPNGIPQRENIKILSAHPGTGVRDAFEFVTRVVTNNNLIIDTTLPYANYNPHKEMGYYYEISDGKNTICLTLREGILVQKFFDYFGKLKNNTASEVEIDDFTDLKEFIEKQVLTMTPNEIFEYEVK